MLILFFLFGLYLFLVCGFFIEYFFFKLDICWIFKIVDIVILGNFLFDWVFFLVFLRIFEFLFVLNSEMELEGNFVFEYDGEWLCNKDF